MSMRLKDFQALASCINQHNKTARSMGGWQLFTTDQLDTLASCLVGINPSFRRELWLDLINER